MIAIAKAVPAKLARSVKCSLRVVVRVVIRVTFLEVVFCLFSVSSISTSLGKRFYWELINCFRDTPQLVPLLPCNK